VFDKCSLPLGLPLLKLVAISEQSHPAKLAGVGVNYRPGPVRVSILRMPTATAPAIPPIIKDKAT
jgi:hypothetical protein